MQPFAPGEIELLLIVGAALVLIIGSRLPPDLVAVLVLVALALSGLLPPDDFVRVGLGMTLVCFVTLLLTMPLVWGI
jgi:hypothetical protein